MKKALAIVAVLAIASMANGLTISVDSDIPAAKDSTVSIPIKISGGETTLQNIQASILVPSGQIQSYDAKTGTVFAASSNTPDPTFIYDAAGNQVASGTPIAQGAYVDFGMPAGGFATASGIIGTLVVGTFGLAPGTYAVVVDGTGNPFGPTNVITSTGVTAQFVNGSFTIPIPEPATLALLGLGGLFLRRRTA